MPTSSQRTTVSIRSIVIENDIRVYLANLCSALSTFLRGPHVSHRDP
jgi:hypothetical protein